MIENETKVSLIDTATNIMLTFISGVVILAAIFLVINYY